MAILTKNEKYIVEMYVRYFGKAPSVAEIAKYNEFGEPKLILTEIIGDADDSNAGLTTEEFVNNAFQNLFGRDATTKEMNKYSKVVDKGEDLPINAIVKAAKKSDKGVYEAKKAIAIMLAEKDNATIYNNLDKITKDTYAKVYDLKAKKLLVDSVADLKTKIDAMKDNVSGTTFNLTTSVDTIVGSDKGDVFNGIVDTNSTLTALDSIDGGLGNDTLNILATTALTLPSGLEVKNVETANLKAGTTIVADTTTWTGLTTANVTKATTASVTAATTTDVNVSGATDDITVKGGNDITITDNTAASSIKVEDTNGDTTGNYATGKITITDTKFGATEKIDVDGGTDVTVTATADKVATKGVITVGASKTATGDVKVVSNTTSDGTAAAAADVTVTGGKTVEITANMTNTAVKGGGTSAITAGTYTVTADNTTTNVTITQNATAIDFENDAAAMVKETSVVTFNNMKANETLIINGLTFTASKDLTATEVAAAFANLTAADTQSATGITANGIYSGTFNSAVWTSSAANGATVTFTAQDNDETDLAFTGTAATNDSAARIPTQVKTAGTAAGASTARNVTEDFGNVVVDDNATKSITTITLDGFDYAALGAGGSLDKLATLNLTNGQGSSAGTVLTSTVATLTVNVDDMAGTVDLDGTAATTLKTLTLNANGEDSKFALSAAAVETLTIAAAADLDISTTPAGYATTALDNVTIKGAGSVNLGVISTATGLVSFNASANTGGVTATVNANATNMTALNADGYVFSAGSDNVTLSNATVSSKVTLGAGDDKITIAGSTLGAMVDGGTGTNTIAMTSANAATASSTTTFEANMTNFSKLQLAQTTTTGAGDTVDLANMDDISYVISSNTFGSNTDVTETADVTFAALSAGQSITIDGVTVTAVADATAIEVAEAFDDTAASLANTLIKEGVDAGAWAAADNAGAATVTFTSATANTNVADLTVTEGNAGQGTNASTTTGAVTNGVNGTSDEFVDFNFTDAVLAVGQQMTFNGYTITAKEAMDKNNIANDFALAAGVVTGTAAKSVGSGTFAALKDDMLGGTWTLSGSKLTITDGTTNRDSNSSATAALAITLPGAATTPTDLAVSTTDGFNSTTNGRLTINSMANNGTLELIAAGAGVTVKMKDASGTSDTFNIVTGDEAGDVGTVVVNSVETINVTTTDIFTDVSGAFENDGVTPKGDGKDDSDSSSTLVVSADAAKTVNVSGAGDLDLSTTSSVLTKVDASKMTGDLFYIADGAAAGTEVIAGSGNDTLIAFGEKDVLKGGAGNDTFYATDLTIVHGGAGADKFYFATPTQLSKVSTIADLGSGDTIYLQDAGAVVGKFFAAGAEINPNTTTTFEAKVNASLVQTGAGESTWFQHAGNTYIVIDGNDSVNPLAGKVDTYTAGKDTVIEITGLKDLSTASFNADIGTLEIA